MAPKRRRESEVTRPAKRPARRSSIAPREAPPAVHHRSHGKEAAKLFVHGQGDCGQLGLGEDVTERRRPFPLDIQGKGVLQAAAGGMHTVALTGNGAVWSWGVNDEGALGRQTTGEIWEKAAERKKGKDGDPYAPGRVEMPQGAGRVIQLSAGDSHTMALTESGAVYGWGTFRDSSGVMGFSPGTRIQLTPALVYEPSLPDSRVARIVSGTDHVVALTMAGKVLTWGSGQQGQLGRIAARTSGRVNITDAMLTPGLVTFKRQRGVHTAHMVDVAAGSYSSFAVTAEGKVEAWGLNNYGQLGQGTSADMHFTPSVVASLAEHKVAQVRCGEHHCLVVTQGGHLLTFGRPTYGGLGRSSADPASDAAVTQPAVADGLADVRVVTAAAGNGVSACVDSDGRLWTFGNGVNCQLGTGGEDDETVPRQQPNTGRLKGHKVLELEFGGQHAALLAVADPNAPATEAAAEPSASGAATEPIHTDATADAAADGTDGGEAVAAPAVNGAALWAAAVARSAQQNAAASAAASSSAGSAAPAEKGVATEAPTAPGAPAAQGAALWAAAVARSAQHNAAVAAASPAAAAPNALPTPGAEAAVPERRAAAPESVADGATAAPTAAGFTGAAAPKAPASVDDIDEAPAV